MNPPEHHADPSAASDLSRRDFTRLAATALVGSLPIGLAGCALLPTKPLSAVRFLDPVHLPTVGIVPGAPSPVAITVRWQNNGGASLTSGMVSVFLVKIGDPNPHCDKKSFTASPTQTTQQISFSFTGTTTFYGQYTIKCYITGTATDGDMDPMAHGHGTTQHC